MDNQVQYEIEPSIYNRRWTILAVLCTSLLIVIVGNTSLNVALPTLSRSLDASNSELQWMIDSYALVFAGLLFTAGSLGDRFGRKRLYLWGIGLFGAASVAIGLAGTTEGVIAFRAVQGLSAAMLMPQTISLLRAAFPREKFGMAIGIWGGISSVAIAAGPLVSGVLVANLGWEWVFYINAPIAVIAIVYGALVIEESEPVKDGRFDVLGVVLLAVFLFALVFGVVQSEAWGWGSGRTIGTFAVAVLMLVAFVVVENRIGNPLLPMQLLRSPAVALGGLVFLANFFAILGVTFLITLFLLNTMGYGTVEAGLRMLPLSAFSIPAAPLGALLVTKIGARRVAALGLAMMGVALLLLALVDTSSSYWLMAVPFVMLAFGSGFAIPSAADLIVGSAPLHLAGVASGFQTTCIQVGGAIGTAVLSAIVSNKVVGAVADAGLPHGTEEAAAAGVRFDGLPQINEAFISGLHAGLVVSAVFALLTAAAVLVLEYQNDRPGSETVTDELVEAEAVGG